MRRLFLGSLVGVGLLLLSAAAPARAEWDFADPGLNLLAGIGFNKGKAVRPYLQGKLILADTNEAALALGIRS